ncbi:hypothetical protein MNV49_005838 [Pseudohyphozyma bogoriensis]|nr:hypothetical protein MNV49_005838 [Pseudohyphozyma bogoriensis]
MTSSRYHDLESHHSPPSHDGRRRGYEFKPTSIVLSLILVSALVLAWQRAPSLTVVDGVVYGALNVSEVEVRPGLAKWGEGDDEYVGMCVSVKGQRDDIPEWLRHYYYHHNIRSFYFFDDGTVPPLSDQLTSLELGIPRSSITFHYITPTLRHSTHQQLSAYESCVRLWGHRHTWLALFDIDEFLEKLIVQPQYFQSMLSPHHALLTLPTKLQAMPDAICPPSPPSSSSDLPILSRASSRSQSLMVELTPPPKTSLLSLPLEIVKHILLETFTHPKRRMEQEGVEDPRSHGFFGLKTAGNASKVSLDTVKKYAATYHDQLVTLMLTSRTFYHVIGPILYASPVLLFPSSIATFVSQSSATPKLPITRQKSRTFGSLIRDLTLFPSTASAVTNELKLAWMENLPLLLQQTPNLDSLTLGAYASYVDLGACVSLVPRLEALDMIELDRVTGQQQKQAAGNAISFIAGCPNLEAVSFEGLNLLEEGYSFTYSRTAMMSGGGADDDQEDELEWRFEASESVWERLRSVLWLREEFGGGAKKEGGLKSFFVWGNSAVGVGALWELMRVLGSLRCLHLDAFTFIGHSPYSSPIYSEKKFLLDGFIQRCAELALTELTFAPLFSDGMVVKGNFDRILQLCPTLTCLELRVDHITPLFFSTLLALPSHNLHYLGLHVLPPHGPRYISTGGIEGIAVRIFDYGSKDEIEVLARTVGEFFGGSGEGGEVGLDWPKGSMEVAGGSGGGGRKEEGFGWYDLLERMARATSFQVAEEGEKWDSDEE